MKQRHSWCARAKPDRIQHLSARPRHLCFYTWVTAKLGAAVVQHTRNSTFIMMWSIGPCNTVAAALTCMKMVSESTHHSQSAVGLLASD